MSVSIQKFDESEEQFALLNEGERGSFRASYPNEVFDELFDERRVALLLSVGHTIYVALCDRIAVGYIAFGFTTENSEKAGYIINIYVREKYRRQGVSKLLLKKVVEFLNEREIKALMLDVTENNDLAKKVYSNFGFLNRSRRMELKIDN